MSRTSFKTFCIEFYANHTGRTEPEVYAEFEENGLYGQSALFIFGQYLEEGAWRRGDGR